MPFSDVWIYLLPGEAGFQAGKDRPKIALSRPVSGRALELLLQETMSNTFSFSLFRHSQSGYTLKPFFL
jgi:hypothetical protein